MENKITKSLVIIGGGPAGLAAAVAAAENGLPAEDILILERDGRLGGILNQCIHNGFGLHTFKEELTGPEYAARFEERAKALHIPYKLGAMVLSISPEKVVTAVSREDGLFTVEAGAVILAMGCRERSRGALNIPGFRPAGVFSAGTAQRLVNMEGYMPGREVVILGSGDIGLIMARRMTLEGAKVLACVEVMPYSGGLTRNIVQCLNDFDIPLYLSHTISDIQGKDRVERVVVSEVGPDRRPIPGTEMTFDCDTVLLSVGLIPENELSRGADIQMDPRTNGPVVYENMETSIPGVFACGNVLHVHDLVDFVTAEAARAGRAAAAYCAGKQTAEGRTLDIRNGSLVGYTVPQHVRMDADFTGADVFFRVRAICGVSRIAVRDESGAQIASFRREHMAPGEMENIRLPRVLLEKAQGAVTVSVEEEQA